MKIYYFALKLLSVSFTKWNYTSSTNATIPMGGERKRFKGNEKTSSIELIPLKLIIQFFLPGLDLPLMSSISLIISFPPSRILSHLFPG
jgi:hypothetical protein